MPNAVLSLLPVAGCAAMMFLCARMMRGGHKPSASRDNELAELRAEVADLRARLGEPAQPDVQAPVR